MVFDENNMGYEFKFETYDLIRTNLPEFFLLLPEFQSEKDGTFFFGTNPDHATVTARIEADKLYICLYVTSREADALVGVIVRQLLSLNDHVVISEL